MPKNKDLKRLVRSRMQKTGESYTTARRHLVSLPKANTTPRPTSPTRPANTTDFARLAGMSDTAVAAKTGRTWQQWVVTLDAAGAAAKTHRDLAKELHAAHGLTTWWAQTVTVGYERIRGRRQVHERPGGFAVTKTRTFAASLTRLAEAFSPAARTQWLGDAPTTPRKSIVGKVARWQLEDGSNVTVNLAAQGPGKSQAQLQHNGLAGPADVARLRVFWHARFDALGDWLAKPAD